MQKLTFEQNVLAQFRKLYFPAIAQGITTGYNIYHKRSESQSPYIVNYLHSDLGTLSCGKPNPHREQLIEKLHKFGPSSINESIADSIVDRIALYKIGDWEENPAGIIFYDAKGYVLTHQQLLEYDGLVVAEGKQYDWGIEIATKHDLEKVISVLNKYTYAKRIGKGGCMLPTKNRCAIVGAWAIPLITITSHPNIKQRGFVPISEVRLSIGDYLSCSLVRPLTRLKNYLCAKGIHPMVQRKLVNGPFVFSYLEADA